MIRHRGYLFIGTTQGVYVRRNGMRSGRAEWHSIPGTEGQCQDLHRISEEDGANSSLLVAGRSQLLEIRPQQGGSDEGRKNWKVHKVSEKHPFVLTELPLKGKWVASGGREGIVILSWEKGQGWEHRLQIKDLPEEVYSIEARPWENGKGTVLWTSFRTKGGFRMHLDTSVLSKASRPDSLRTISYERSSKKAGIELTTFTGEGTKRKGLPEGQVLLFYFQDSIVAATETGLYQYSEGPENNIHWDPDTSLGCLFGNCSNKRREKARQVFLIREGTDGSVWIHSRNVHHLIPEADGEYYIDSLPFKGTGLGAVRAIYPDSGGVTWLGGDNGIVRYDGDVEKDFGRPYRCLMREVRAPLKNTASAKKDTVLFGGFYRKSDPENSLLGWKRAWEQPEAFVPSLPYTMNGLAFRYAAPYYEGQEEVEYSYRLVGFDEEWSQWEKETKKEYTNLPEGSYTFKVKAKNVYGMESKAAEYHFRILPPWYRTWTAYGGYTIVGIGFIWLLLWLNSRRLIAQKERLERTVEERTREIQEEKTKMEKKNKALEDANETISKQKEEVEKQQQETEKQREEAENQKEQVEAAHEKLSEAHEEITQSIDYAQKIQYALLQSEEHVSPNTPEHFILFKPQSQVSGDFYWAREHKGHLYIAAVDCTGHGVPGAFMSMLGISQLNEIMAADELLTPGQILTELRDRVVRELSGSESGETAKDGMDAAILKIPVSNPKAQSPDPKKIEFAGAQNPLYVVRKGIAEDDPLVGNDHDRSLQDRLKPFKKSSDGIEIKGDPMPVGYDEYASGDFTTVSLEAQKGDMLYIFSDGYADQFGGPKGKKFRYGPFKKLLAELHERPVEEQKRELDRAFEEWKAESQQEQIDDVVVVGVRV